MKYIGVPFGGNRQEECPICSTLLLDLPPNSTKYVYPDNGMEARLDKTKSQLNRWC